MKTPCDLDAERSVIGACLLDPRACDEALARLRPSSFYLRAHEEVFGAIAELVAGKIAVDEVTVAGELGRRGSTVDATTLAALAHETPSTANVDHYCRLVAEASTRRGIMHAASRLAAEAASGEGEPGELLDRASAALVDLAKQTTSASTVSIRAAFGEFYATIDKATRGEVPQHARSGFPDLDRVMGGLMPGALIVVAARPGMGKTAFATRIATHVATQKPVLFVSLEMPRSQLLGRIAAADARVPHTCIRDALSGTSKLGQQWFAKILGCIERLKDLPLEFVDQCDGTVIGVRALARRLAQERGGLGLVVVDYLQLMHGSDPRAPREQQVASVSRGLKMLALELNCPVMALAQLNRGAEARENKRPMLSELRESGSIEQDSDVVLMLYRDGYYKRQRDAKADDTTAEVIIAKNRHGEGGGYIELKWTAEYTRFDSFAKGDW